MHYYYFVVLLLVIVEFILLLVIVTLDVLDNTPVLYPTIFKFSIFTLTDLILSKT